MLPEFPVCVGLATEPVASGLAIESPAVGLATESPAVGVATECPAVGLVVSLGTEAGVSGRLVADSLLIILARRRFLLGCGLPLLQWV